MQKILFSTSLCSITSPETSARLSIQNILFKSENQIKVGIQNRALENAAEASSALLMR
jgi:hypothetical protein